MYRWFILCCALLSLPSWALDNHAPPLSDTLTAPQAAAPLSEEITKPEPTPTWGPLKLLNTELEPNSMATLDWFSGHLSGGFELATPVIAIHGLEAGPRVCITAALHGDELNGVELARRVVRELTPSELKGTVIVVPVVNIDGMWRQDRYMSDRRDLNRVFPGSPLGSTASRVAYSLFNSIVRGCDSLIDLHSGSMFRENLTQLRADMSVPSVAKLTTHFGAISVVHSTPPQGSLRQAASEVGINSVVMELGGPYIVDERLVELGVKSLLSYLSSQKMLAPRFFWPSPQPVFYASQWLRSRTGGILINKVKLGDTVYKDQVLGTIANPIDDHVEQIRAPFHAVVLGRAQNQIVSAGFAIYHLGERRSIDELEHQAEQQKHSAHMPHSPSSVAPLPTSTHENDHVLSQAEDEDGE